MIPKTIHRIWLGSEMPQQYRDYGERWAALHPHWTMRMWTEADLSWLTNRGEFEEAEHWSTKSDIARYEIVLREGGMYVDTDFEPIKPFDDVLDGASLVLGEQTSGVLNNAFFAAEEGHPFLEYLVGELPTSFHGRTDAGSPIRCGPDFLTRCYRRWSAFTGAEARILRPHEVYPYSYDQMHLSRRTFPEALAVHHWAKSWVAPVHQRSSLRSNLRVAAKQAATRVKRLTRKLSARWEALDSPPSYVSRKHTSIYAGDGRILTNTLEGFPILSLANDLGITPSLVARGTYDPGFLWFIRRILKRGDVFVDVGANIGLFSVAAGWVVGPTGLVLAYEANPGINDVLVDSIHLNHMLGMPGRVKAFNLAASDYVGEIELRVPVKDPGRATTRARPSNDEPHNVLAVPATRLDEELTRFPEVKLLKIDVEGGELGVLRGLRETIQGGRVRFLDLELIDEHAGADWPDLVRELKWISHATEAKTFRVGRRGDLIPWSIDAALHTDRLQHFIFKIPTRG